MKKAISKRFRVTKKGKVIRRKMGVNHFRVRKSKHQKVRERKSLTTYSADFKLIQKEMNRC